MKGLYIVYQHPERRTGLFYATHNRIKSSVPHLSNFKIINLCYYDNWFVSILKYFAGIKPTKRGEKMYFYDGLNYENFWIKRSLFHSITPWGTFDKIRTFKFLFNENFLFKNRLKYLITEASTFDFIMAHWANPNGSLAMKLSNYTKIPFFVTYHGSDLNTAPYINEPSFKAVFKMLETATLNITVSESLLKKALQICPRANMYVSPNGIGQDIIQNYGSLTFPKKDELINIIFIGNLIDDKRADLLPEIIRLIVSNTKRELHFTILGDGKYKSYIQNELEENNISFTLPGQVDSKEVFRFLKEAHLLILPSRTEGMPLVILEAIATNTIPIASNVGGISEILEMDFLVNEGDSFINDFATKVVSKIDKPTYPQLKIQNYTWDVIMKREIEKIKKLICK